jgi:hypothetical protein
MDDEVLAGAAFQMVQTSSGSSTSNSRLLNRRPPVPLELMEDEDQIGVREPITMYPLSYTSPVPALPQVVAPQPPYP